MKTSGFKSAKGRNSQLDSISTTRAKKSFAPLISTSLALALCASFANAAGGSSAPTCTASGDNPSVCVNGGATDESSNLKITWTDDGGYSKFENAHNLFEFNIYKGSGNSVGEQKDGYYVVYIKKNANDPSFALTTSANKGLKIGNGKGKLKIQFADARPWNNAQAVLNLTGTTNDGGSNVALFGNLLIEGGVNKPITENGNHIHTLATFGGDIKGNVQIKDYFGRTSNNSLTFNSGKITGSVSNLGGLTITFKEIGGIGGGLSTGNAGLNNIDLGKTTISLEKGGDISGGVNTNGATTSITSDSGTTNISGGITTTRGTMAASFAGTTNTITGNIATDSGSSEIKATNNSGANRITGDISAQGTAGTINKISFSGNSNEIHGAITATNKGMNIITLGVSGGTSAIQGDITHTGGGVDNSNSSEASKFGRNEITFTSNGSITGDIKAECNGKGWAGTVKNLITFNNATNSIIGNISSDDGGSNNYGNIITFSGTSTGSNTIRGNITSSASAWGSSGNNIINFNASNATNEIVGDLITSAGQNKITFAGASSTYSITGNIQSTGGKNIITITDGTSATFTGDIKSASGNNTVSISAGTSASFAGNIDNNAGTVSITSSNASTALSINEADSIISTYGGVKANTNIQSVGTLTINLKSIQVTSNGNPYNTNTIIAKKAGGNKIATSEGIQTKHWKATTNLAINGNANDTTSSVLSSNIINYGSTNIILQDATWLPSSIKQTTKTTSNSGVLTNYDGTTNLVIRTTKAVSGQTGLPVYKVNANGGIANIVMQGDASAVANINYGGGKANLLFVSNNDNADDSFNSKKTNIDSNQVLGKTYYNGVKLALHDYNVSVQDVSKSLIDTFGDHFRNTNGDLLTLDVSRSIDKDTIKIHGLVSGDIYSLGNRQANKRYEVLLAENSAFVGTLGLESSNISLTMGDNSKLVLAGGKDTAYAKIATLTLKNVGFDSTQIMNPIFDQTNTVINLATGVNDVYNAPNRKDFRLLEIGTKGSNTADTGLVGNNALFQVYVNTNAGSDASLGGKTKTEWGTSNYGSEYSADRIVVHNVGDNTTASTQNLQIVYDAGVQIDSIHYTQGGTETNGNIAVATVVNKSGTQNATSGQASQNGAVKFNLQSTLQGFDEITSTLVGVYTDEYGVVSNGGSNNTYTTYFVNNARSSGASEANREATATALGANYDLYMANFNSLNKRMGELRDNPHTQGAWLRIFNGSQTNDMGLGTKSNYTTFQGGYDYAFGFEGANNYVGLAIAYGLSDSKTQGSMTDLNGSQRGVENIKSNTVEVAIYNAYVQDEGWYNDTIAKFSYIFSDFNMMGQSSTYSTNNMAFTISDEFGYRFKLGANKEWYIDPQFEMAFGYFDQSDFVQKLGVATLDGNLDSITTLRTRVGSSFGYNFKNFTENKPVKASLYVGAFYEFDYISGGDVTMTTNLGSTNSINSLSSDGRIAVNVGTNIEVYNNTRIYFDFESSFAGKIRTDYQVNIGARYSFGDNTTYSPIGETKKDITPLKINNESKEEATTSEPNTNSAEAQAEQKAQ